MVFRTQILLAGLLISILTHASEINSSSSNEYMDSWKEWRAEREVFLSCMSNTETARFLSKAIEIHGNAELEEANNGTIATGILNNPSCILDALVGLPESAQTKIINIYIARPLFNDISEIEGSLSKMWSKPEYNHIKVEFLKAKEAIYAK